MKNNPEFMFDTILQKVLFIFLFGLSQISFAQEIISGSVYNAKDSTALDAVSVFYDGTSLGTTTNSSGFFSLEKYNGQAPLVISFLGYETVIVTISSPASK